MKTFIIALLLYVTFQAVLLAQSGSKMGVGPIFKNKQEAKRKALVLANQNYQHQAPLKNTLCDADSMAAALRYLGFEVMLVKDKTLAETQDAIDQFTQSLQAGDVAFVYYSGHGLGYMYDNFLLPINFDAQCASQVPNRAISLRKLTSGIQNRSVRNLLLVVDACRDQGFAEVCPDKSIQSPITHLVPPDKNPNGILLAFATDYGQTATYLSTQNRNSLYTESLLLYLRQPLELQDIFTRAARRTNQESRKLHQLNSLISIQEPIMSNKIYDNYYFLQPGSYPLIPSSQPTVLVQTPANQSVFTMTVIAYKVNSRVLDFGLAKKASEELKQKLPDYDIQLQTNKKGLSNEGIVCTITRKTIISNNTVEVNNTSFDLIKADTDLVMTFTNGKQVLDQIELSEGGTDHQQATAIENSIKRALNKLKDIPINLPTPTTHK